MLISCPGGISTPVGAVPLRRRNRPLASAGSFSPINHKYCCLHPFCQSETEREAKRYIKQMLDGKRGRERVPHNPDPTPGVRNIKSSTFVKLRSQSATEEAKELVRISLSQCPHIFIPIQVDFDLYVQIDLKKK